MATNLRRQYFIDKSFQARFILKFCSVVIISSIVITGAVFFLTQGSTTVAIENTKVMVKRTADFILPLLLLTVIVASVVTAAVTAVLTLLASHKIAGPLFRIVREVGGVAEGDLRRNFSIRSKDQLQELAKRLEAMCASLRSHQAELKVKCQSLAACVKEAGANIPADQKEKIARLLDEIDTALHYFKV